MNLQPCSRPFAPTKLQSRPTGGVIPLFFLFAVGCSNASSPEQMSATPAEQMPMTAVVAEPPNIEQELPPVFAEEAGGLRHEFSVVNNTDHIVCFEKVINSCGCAGSDLKDKKLAPGQATTLRLEVNLHGRKGPQRYSCRLIPEGDQPAWVYAVKTQVYQRVAFYPPDVHLGVLEPNTGATDEVTLEVFTPPGEPEPEIRRLACTSEEVTPTIVRESREVQPDGATKRTRVVRLALGGQSSPGRGETELTATLARAGGQDRVSSRLHWNVRSLYVISPPRAYFGELVGSDRPVEQTVSLSRADGKALAIKSIKISDPALSHRIVPGSSEKERQIVFQLDPKRVDGPFWGEAVIETDCTLQPTIKLPFAAFRRGKK